MIHDWTDEATALLVVSVSVDKERPGEYIITRRCILQQGGIDLKTRVGGGVEGGV